jgi:hypothetical protein
MSISQVRANYGLRAIGTPSSPTASGNVNLGIQPTTETLTDADVFYAIEALIVGSTSDLVIDLADGDKSGSTSWTSGVAQIETATAAGTITLAGNAEVIVTASGMTGTPKTILVPVALNDTAATWAGKVRAALAADAAVSALFTVGGTTTAISLTRKPLATYTVGAASVPTYPANDTTLNISLDNGTCTGITTAASSANSTAGVLSAGCYVVGDGVDFEGNPLIEIDSVRVSAYMIRNESVSPDSILVSTASTMSDVEITSGGALQLFSSDENNDSQVFAIKVIDLAKTTIIVAGSST